MGDSPFLDHSRENRSSFSHREGLTPEKRSIFMWQRKSNDATAQRAGGAFAPLLKGEVTEVDTLDIATSFGQVSVAR